MAIIAASIKAKMFYGTAHSYYNNYMEDPNHNIPVQLIQKSKQDQIKSLVGYIADDMMTVAAASAKAKAKANMAVATSRKYYHKYSDDPNHDIPVADPQNRRGSHYTQEQVNRLISFIVDDKMTVVDVAKKANITDSATWKYYQKYKNAPNHRIPVVGSKSNVYYSTITQDKIKWLIGYITEDKVTLTAASRKAKMSVTSGRKYYQKYRNDPNNDAPIHIVSYPTCTQEQVTILIRYITEDKMSVEDDASKKANMSNSHWL